MTMTKTPQPSDLDAESSRSSPTTLNHHSLTPHSSGTNTPMTIEQDRELLFDQDDIDNSFGHNRRSEELPEYEASSSRSRAVEQAQCSILPSRAAVWTIKDTNIRLSAFVAAILLHQGIINTKDLDVYHNQAKEADQGPSDPISGIFKSVHGTVGGIVQGIADYPVEITKIVQAGGDVAKGLATDFAMDSNKGVSRIIGTGLRAPGDFTMNISRGFANAPKLYGDETVRPVEKVDGVVSGLEAAGKGFGYGLWDGLSGLYTQPAKGAEEGGVLGFFGGLGKGIGGAVFKPVAGAVGISAYAFKGVYEEVARLTGGSEEDKEKAALLKQGNEEWSMCTGEERKAILGMWYTFNAQEGIVMHDHDREQGKWN
ncbi:uncharacterized protein PAC_05126 [Phialocephala subalpina]|uniref:Glycosyltransferase family 1 protein n=1 Tax=Phialocephala subalpina TaxID=576137 RepID=A0A1L7WR37_9HELO|nr:uncharacterized protein PAC_05126 [Phialocephala subalpina]